MVSLSAHGDKHNVRPVTSRQTNLLGLSRRELESFFTEIGEKSFRARQVMQWIYQRRELSFGKMTDLSKLLRLKLEQSACLEMPEIVKDQQSIDGTRKWLLRLADGNCIETVFIPESDRGTLCISSQVGCLLTCTFCATARQGFSRNLDSAEIISQLMVADALLEQAQNTRTVSNIVMMGMGEPLLNYENVIPAMNLMLDDLSYGLSRRRVTLSTAGVVPAIYRLKSDCPVSLAVSLHAADDALRNMLVPINKKYPLAQLMQACRDYVSERTRRRVTFEYVMLDGVNDSDETAKKLVSLINNIPCKVNLIPFNSVSGINYRCSPTRQLNRFREILLDAGIFTITRKTRGDDIDAACGQLAGKVRDITKRSQRLTVNAPASH